MSVDVIRYETARDRSGGTLDVIITLDDYTPADTDVDHIKVSSLTIHILLSWRLPVPSGPPPEQVRRARSWRSVDRREAIEESTLCQPLSSSMGVDDMFSQYDAVLRDIVDRLAPEHFVHTRLRYLSPWFDADCRDAVDTVIG